MLKRIGAEEGGEFKAVASGTLPSGQPVIINADGTVSVVSETSVTQAAGSPTVFETASSTGITATFDSNSNKVVIAYTDNGNSFQGTAVVGTVSNTSITFGTPVVFNAGSTKYSSATFDSNSNKVVIAYRDDGANDHGYAIVGTVSGTSISFGSEVIFNASTMTSALSATFDSSSNKIVIAYQDKGNADYGTAIVGTVSGTSISFGTEVVFESAQTEDISATFDSNSNKIVIAYRDSGNTGDGTAIVGTVSGTSISFGSATVFDTASTEKISIAYDTNAQKVVITYKDGGNSNYGTAIVGTVSGTSISFGTEVVFESSFTESAKAIYDTTAQKIVIAYYDSNNSEYGTVISGTVSGTSISFDSATVFESAAVDNIGVAYDSNANKVVVAYKDKGNSDYGTSVVFQPGYTSTNLTSENYIGISKGGAVADTKGATVDIIGAIADIPKTHYNLSNASYDSVSFSVGSQASAPRTLVFGSDGTRMYVGQGGGGIPIYQYSLSTGYDISTASYDSVSFSPSSQDSAVLGIRFKTDGTKMFALGYNNRAVFQYSLSTAWNIGTASYDSVSFSVSSQVTDGVDLVFKPDGTKMFILDDTTDDIFQYTLSSAWDISSASYDSVSFDASSLQTSSNGMQFSVDGKVIFLVGQSGDSVDQINLSTGFDLSTGTAATSFSAASQDTKIKAVDFNSDGTKMFLAGDDNDSVFQYSIEGSGLTAGQQYYVQTDGTISTTADSPSVLAGTAISATELLVKT